MAILSFRPVRADEIDCRVQSINSYKVTILLYKDARVDQNILDETVGAYNWQRSHSRENANCVVSLWDSEKKQWVSKEDTGTESNTEAQKGLASDSFKRACFNWGIGRELYTTPLVQIDTKYVEIKTDGNRKTTYDKFYVQDIEVAVDEKTGTKRITKLTIGIEHKGQREWVWSWAEGNAPKQHKPSWVGSEPPADEEPKSAPVSRWGKPANNQVGDAPAPAPKKSWGQQPPQNGNTPAPKKWGQKSA